MRIRRLLIGIVASVSAVACGGAPSATDPAQPQNVMVEDDAKGGVMVAGAPGARHDVSPVEAPGAMVMHLRWASPGKTIATAVSFANLPSDTVSSAMKKLVAEAIDEAIGEAVDSAKLAEVVNLDAPIDLVGVADLKKSRQVPEPMMAWAIGLTSLEGALAASKGKAREIGNGVWRIGTESRWGAPCAVAASAGVTAARLVCTERERHLEVMAPYMARNVALIPPSKSDVRAELNFRGVLDKYGRQWGNQARGLPVIAEEFKLGIPQFDAALLDAADALSIEAGDLLHDADSVVAEFALDRKKGITMMMHVGFAGKKSWLVQTMVDGAEKAGPAPDIFWHAPKASESITWARSGDPKRWEPVLETARALAEGLMAKEKIGSDADRKAIVALLSPAGNPYVATVSSTGHFAPTSAGSGAIGDVLDAAVGWYLIGIDQGPNDLRAWLNDAVKVYNRPSLQKMMKDEMGSDAKHLPKVKVVPAPRNLGGGALAIEVIIPDVDDPMEELTGEPIDPDALSQPQRTAAKPKPVDIKFYLLMMSDSGRTWLGLAANRDGLAKVMDSVKGATPGADTIKGKPGLDVFRTKKHSAGGVTTLEGIIGSIKPMAMTFMTLGGAPQGPARMILNVLERMPNKGESPIVVMGYVDGGVKPSVEATFNVPEGTLVDLGYVVTNIISIVGANP